MVALLLATLALCFVGPMCYCPRYYIAVTAVGVLPLLLGPALWRGVAVVYIAYGVLRVVAEYRGATLQAEQLRQQAAYNTQQKAIYEAQHH